jgi:hypothetical protein
MKTHRNHDCYSCVSTVTFSQTPVVVALYKQIPNTKTFLEAVFSGHFGPIGIGTSLSPISSFLPILTFQPGAIFISILAVRVIHQHPNKRSHQGDMVANVIQPIVAFVVLHHFSLGRHVLRLVYLAWHAQPEGLNPKPASFHAERRTLSSTGIVTTKWSVARWRMRRI